MAPMIKEFPSQITWKAVSASASRILTQAQGTLRFGIVCYANYTIACPASYCKKLTSAESDPRSLAQAAREESEKNQMTGRTYERSDTPSTSSVHFIHKVYVSE